MTSSYWLQRRDKSCRDCTLKCGRLDTVIQTACLGNGSAYGICNCGIGWVQHSGCACQFISTKPGPTAHHNHRHISCAHARVFASFMLLCHTVCNRCCQGQPIYASTCDANHHHSKSPKAIAYITVHTSLCTIVSLGSKSARRMCSEMKYHQCYLTLTLMLVMPGSMSI